MPSNKTAAFKDVTEKHFWPCHFAQETQNPFLPDNKNRKRLMVRSIIIIISILHDRLNPIPSNTHVCVVYSDKSQLVSNTRHFFLYGQIIYMELSHTMKILIPNQELGRSKIKLTNYYIIWMAQQAVPQSDFIKSSCVSNKNQWSGYDETTSFIIPEHNQSSIPSFVADISQSPFILRCH